MVVYLIHDQYLSPTLGRDLLSQYDIVLEENYEQNVLSFSLEDFCFIWTTSGSTNETNVEVP